MATLEGPDTYNLGSLTAAGPSSSCLFRGMGVFQVRVNGIGTSVSYVPEGSVDNIDFFALTPDNQPYTVTEDNCYGYSIDQPIIRFVRLRVTDISGGTPTILAKVSA